VYSLANIIDREGQSYNQESIRHRLRQASLHLDLALATSDDQLAASVFNNTEHRLQSMLDDPEMLTVPGLVAYSLHNYLPVFRRRREEPRPSHETMQLARSATANSLAAALRLHHMAQERGRALIAERAIEGLLVRTGDPDLLPYPATEREDRGIMTIRPTKEILSCLRDSYVIYKGGKVPIQTKSRKHFSNDPTEHGYYNNLVAKVSYRETTGAAVADQHTLRSHKLELLSRLLAKTLVADLRGDHVSPRMRDVLNTATDHIVNIVRTAANA